jgi:hypothetical protein
MHNTFSNLKGFYIFIFDSEGDGDGWSIMFDSSDKELNGPRFNPGDGIGCGQEEADGGNGFKFDYIYGVGDFGYNDGDGEPSGENFSLAGEEELDA